MIRKAKNKRRTGRGAILLIAMMLVSSALLRLISGAGDALAQATDAPETPVVSEAAGTKAGDAQTSDTASTEMSRVEISGLLTALREREKRVKALELQIEMRSKALAVADAEITKRLETLEQTEANLRRTLALADGAAEDDLARLTSVYENMKPKDAAALFETMEPDFAAGFLGRMRPDAAAAVMAGLPPEVAYSISVILAGRNAKAPKS